MLTDRSGRGWQSVQILGTIFYGLISGFAEFLPISASAHQFIFSYMTGFSGNHAFVQMMISIGCLAAVFLCCRSRLTHIRRELRLVSMPKKRRKRVPDMQAVSDFRLVMTASVSMLLGLFCYKKVNQTFSQLTWIGLTLILTGILVYLPQFTAPGNRNSRGMNRVEGLSFGLFCALSVIPGLSRTALVTYFGHKRKCSGSYCMELVLLFSIPFLLGMILVHLITVLSMGATMTWAMFFVGLLAATCAFAGALTGITLMRYLAVKFDFHGFSYYCWGLSFFCFIYYLMT